MAVGSSGHQAADAAVNSASGAPTAPTEGPLQTAKHLAIDGEGSHSTMAAAPSALNQPQDAVPPLVLPQAQTQPQTGGPNGKRGRGVERDSVNALLSLGRDLTEGEIEAQEAPQPTTETLIVPKQAPLPMLAPVMATTAKKRQKKAVNNNVMIANAQMGYKYPEDFWYWLPPGDSLGEWDVLCGRGGESNNYIGNRRYRKIVDERKPAYREIPLKQRKAKTAYVRSIVQHVNNCGGRFVDLDDVTGQYYVVTMEKARKKTSQALRETKELKWLEVSPEPKVRKTATATKNLICPYCEKQGHKTKIAKSCLKHHEWIEANAVTTAKFADQQAKAAQAAAINAGILDPHNNTTQPAMPTQNATVPFAEGRALNDTVPPNTQPAPPTFQCAESSSMGVGTMMDPTALGGQQSVGNNQLPHNLGPGQQQGVVQAHVSTATTHDDVVAI